MPGSGVFLLLSRVVRECWLSGFTAPYDDGMAVTFHAGWHVGLAINVEMVFSAVDVTVLKRIPCVE